MRPRAILYVQTVSLVFCLMAGTLACAQQPNVPLERSIDDDLISRTGDIDIRGTVLSEDGKQLTDVTVEYVALKYGDAVLGEEPTERILETDGSFRIRGENVSSISVSVFKTGYYDAGWNYTFSEDTPRQYPGTVEIVEANIRLVRKPKPAPLEEYSGVLKTSPTGPVDVLHVANPGKFVGPLTTMAVEEWKSRKVEQPFVFLEGLPSEDGGFSINQVILSGHEIAVDILAKAWLKQSGSGADDGFVEYEPLATTPRKKLVFREMNRAPVAGYERAIELGLVQQREYVYFFVRIDGRYGKGMIVGKPVVANESGVDYALASIVVFMNPTGSMDVSYLHY